MNLNFLLDSEPWLQYLVNRNVLNKSKEDLTDLQKAVLADNRIQTYLEDLSDFHSILVTNHKNPDLPILKLHFLLDIGLDTEIPQIKMAVDQIKAHRDENGVYQSLTNVPKHYGGTGTDIFAWCLCDAPLLLSALVKAGCDYNSDIKPGVDYLLTFIRENGFPCTVSQELGKFRGPGSKGELCPNATLQMLKLLSLIPECRNSTAAGYCIEGLLQLWEDSKTRHPYQFYMGTDFRKLKAPMIWYDIVSVTDCLSYFEQAKKDSRFREMLAVIEQKQDEEGLFVPESVFLKYRDWDFGQKKKPSPYLTYLCTSILERSEN